MLLGMAEFGRMLAIYGNLLHPAREGTRYGLAHPRDVSGIVSAAVDNIVLIDPAQVALSVQFDSGPGTPNLDTSIVQTGDWLIATLHYDIKPMLPLLQPLVKNLYVETVAARTIANLALSHYHP